MEKEQLKRLNDHIKPCAKFNLENSLEQKLCFLYKNLQPLWAEENLEKRDKYDSRKERSSYC